MRATIGSTPWEPSRSTRRILLALLLSSSLGCNQRDPGDLTTGAGTTAVDMGTATAGAPPSETAGMAEAGITAVMAGSSPEAGQGGAGGQIPVGGMVTDPSAGEEAPARAPSDALYPLVDGAYWVYRHSGGSTGWDEEVHMRAVRFAGAPAMELRDTAGPSGGRSLSYLMTQESGATVRVHKQVYVRDNLESVVDYDPGFLRFEAQWAQQATGYSLERTYQRTASDLLGNVIADGPRTHRFTLVEHGVDVQVPAGSFSACLQVERMRIRAPDAVPADGDHKRFWFCPGVGKVKELDVGTGKTEELLRCHVPAGRCP